MQGMWLCPRCTTRMAGGDSDAGSAEVAVVSFGHWSGGETAWRMAERLGSVEYR